MNTRFVIGIVVGAAVVTLAFSLSAHIGIEMRLGINQALVLGAEELREALWVFIAVLVAYVFQLAYFWTALKDDRLSIDSLARNEQLLELYAALFFGIGVIWTAIGMRAALVQALDQAASTDLGAVDLLSRLVDGGILLALSTTIVGGIGGYLMRAIKAILVGGLTSKALYRRSEMERIEILDAFKRLELVITQNSAWEGKGGR